MVARSQTHALAKQPLVCHVSLSTSLVY